jgi:hypothetical protein
MTMVNLPTAGVDYHVPFGGSKSSSYGTREQGFAAVEFFTQTKTSLFRRLSILRDIGLGADTPFARRERKLQR